MDKIQKKDSSAGCVPDIFEYLDYRRFLYDICEKKKELNPHFSYRYLSQKLNIKSAGFLSWVLQGKRNISSRLVIEIVRFFKLNNTEGEYFENLVTFNQATTHEQRRHAFDKILVMRRGVIKQIEADACEFYRKWYYPALRELVAVMSINDNNINDVAAKLYPPVKTNDIKDALSTLLRLGLVIKGENGVYRRTDQVISSRENIPLVALHDYQISCLEIAKATIDAFEKSERELSTVTMSIDDEAYISIIDRLAVMRREVMEIARSVKKPSRVMQLNMQYFPLTLSANRGER